MFSKGLKLSHLFIIVIIIAVIGGSFWRYGYPLTHSVALNVVWSFQFAQQFFDGQLYPRWLEMSYASMGSPTFVFYPPVCMFATVPFSALGFSPSNAVAGSMLLGMFVMAIGVYGYSHYLMDESRYTFLPLLVTVLTILSPYLLSNILVRGTLAEVWAMACLPWLLWRTHLNLKTGNHWLSQSLCYSLLAFSHLPTLLNFTLLYVTLPLLLNFGSVPFHRLIIRLYLPLLAGLGLASIFLVPAALDQHYIALQNSSMFKGIFDPLNRLMVTGLTTLHPEWTTDYEATFIPLFTMSLITGIIAVYLFLRQYPRLLPSLRGEMGLWTLCLGFSIFMMTDLSTFLYQTVDMLRKIQFSWRWLAIVVVVVPLLLGAFLAHTAYLQTPLLKRFCQTAVGLFVLLWLGFAVETYSQTPWDTEGLQFIDKLVVAHPPFPKEIEVTETPHIPVIYQLMMTAKGQVLFNEALEYLPRWVNIFKILSIHTNHNLLIEWAEGNGTVETMEWEYGRRHFVVNSDTGGKVYLHMFAWPGWQVWLNGHATAQDIAPDGRLSLILNAGRTTVDILYLGTPNERLGWILSCLTLLSLLAIFLFHLRARRRIEPPTTLQ